MSAAIAIYALALTVAVLATVAFTSGVSMPDINDAIRASFIGAQ